MKASVVLMMATLAHAGAWKSPNVFRPYVEVSRVTHRPPAFPPPAAAIVKRIAAPAALISTAAVIRVAAARPAWLVSASQAAVVVAGLMTPSDGLLAVGLLAVVIKLYEAKVREVMLMKEKPLYAGV